MNHFNIDIIVLTYYVMICDNPTQISTFEQYLHVNISISRIGGNILLL